MSRRRQPHVTQPIRQQTGAAAWVLIMTIATVAVYANSLRVPLVLDDHITVTENPQIRTLWSTAVFLPERELPVAGRPLVNATLALNYALDGVEPRGYHAVNLLLHILCGLLLFALVRRVLAPGEQKEASRQSSVRKNVRKKNKR